MFGFARCMNITFNSQLTQLVKYDVHTTRKIKFIHAIFVTYYYFTYEKLLIVDLPSNSPQCGTLHVSLLTFGSVV